MFLKVNDTEYEVDIEPLRGKMLTGLNNLIDGAGASATSSVLRQIVKQACNLSLSPLGLVKQDRNDDPIQLVAGKIADIIFTQIQAGGLHLSGRELVPFEPKKEEVPDNANNGDGGGQVEHPRGDG